MPPDSPFSDLSRPPLRQHALQQALTGPHGPWAQLEVVASTGSTNDDLAERTRRSPGEELPHGSVLVAEHQSTGRGRLGRTWSAPPRSSLAVSVLVRPGVALGRWSWLPLLTGVAVADAVTQVCGLPARLKWPNDVLVPTSAAGESHAKLGGVLAEVVATPEGAAAVLGVGLNVSLTTAELPTAAATSLLLAGSATLDRDVVLRAYLRALARRYRDWAAADGNPRASGLAAAYRETCATIGQRVRLQLPGGAEQVGLADGVDDEGRLLLLGDDGTVVAHAAGDVVHLRPEPG